MARVVQIAVTDPGYEALFLYEDGRIIRRYLVLNEAKDRHEHIYEQLTLPSPE